MAGMGSHGGGGFGQWAGLNNQLQLAVGHFTALTSAAGSFGMAVNAFREFERQITLTNAAAGGTVVEFNRMSDAARNFALVSTASAVEAANSLYFLATAGFSVNESLTMMNSILVLSQATLTDVAFTADVMASNIQAFGLEAYDAARISNLFAASMAESMASMDKLAFAFRQVAPAAAAVGQSIEATTAQLSELFNIGLRGEQAGTQLRNIIVRLARPVGDAAVLLKEMGVQTTDAYGELRNLRDVLIEIGNAGFTTSELSAIFGVEGVAGGIALINAAMSGSLDEMEASITGTNRAFEMFAQTLDTLDGSLQQSRNAFSELLLTVGETVAEPISDLALMFTDLVRTFRDMDAETKSTIVTFVAFTAAAIAMTTAVRALWFLMAPLVTGIGSLTAAILMSIPAVATWVNTVKTLMALNAASMGTGLLGWFRNISMAAVSATPALSAMVSAFTAITGITLSPAAMGLVAVTGVIGGVAVAGTLVYGVYQLWKMWKNAGEAAVESSRQQVMAAMEANDVIKQLEGGEDFQGSNIILETARRRTEQANLLYADATSGLERLAALSSNVRDRLRVESANIEQYMEDYRQGFEDQFATGFDMTALGDAIYEARQELERATSARNAAMGGAGAGGFGAAVALAQNEDFQEAEDAWIAAQNRLDELMGRIGDNAQLEADIEGYIRNVAAGKAKLKEFADEIAKTEGSYGEIVAAFTQEIIGGGVDISSFAANEEDLATLKQAIDRNKEVINQAITSYILEGGPIDLRSIIAIVEEQARASGDAQWIAVFDAMQKAELEAITLSLESAQGSTEGFAAEIALRIAEARASLSDKVEDKLVASNLRERMRFTDMMRKYSADQVKAIEQAFAESSLITAKLVDSREIAELKLSQEASGLMLGDALSMTAVIDAVAEAAKGGASPEQLQAIADAKIAEHMLVLNIIVAQLLAQSKITQEFADSLIEQGNATAAAVSAAIEAFSLDLAVGAAGASKTGGGGKDPVEEAKKLRREYEDAFMELRGIGIDAAKTIADIGSMDLSTRLNLMVQVDIANIIADYEAQIVRLEREMEDAAKKFAGQPLELDPLIAGYEEMISLVKQARDAEIEYTQSFTAMSARRDEAINREIDNLRDRAVEAGGLQLGLMAGIEAGLLRYQQNMITAVDTVANATYGAMDAISQSVGQWVTQGGSFIEILRNNLLSVMGTLAQEATRGILQQIAMQMTGGAGAFGQLFASAGGAIGGVMGGVMGGGALAPQMLAMQTSLTAFNTGMAATLSASAAQTQVTVTTFGVQFQAALQQAVAAVTSAAASAGAAGGGGLLSSLPFFDDGGFLPAGKLGVAGEYGPELIRGPASITGRRESASIMGAAAASATPVINNIIVQDESVVARYLAKSEGQRQIVNIVNRRNV